MGSLLFDYLLDSPFFEAGSAEENFGRLSDVELSLALRNYREFVLKNLDALHQEIQGSGRVLRVLAPQEDLNLGLIRHLSLYVQQFLLRDPLFPLTREKREINLVERRFSKSTSTSNDLSRSRLAKAIRRLRFLQPFVAADYVKILPVSYLREPPANLPIYFDRDNFSKVLPEETMKFIHEHALVESVVEAEGGGWRTDGGLYPCRSIHVTFKGHSGEGDMFYQLTQQKPLSFSDVDGGMLVTFEVIYPEEPPNLELFETWVNHAINRTALNQYDLLMAQSMLAAEHGANYLTDSQFSFGLLQRSFAMEPSIASDTINQLLHVDLPFLENIRSEDLMKVRLEEGEAFESFRLALEKGLREIRSEKDPEAARLRMKNTVHELCEVQVQAVSRKARQLRTRFFADAVLLVGTLAAAVQHAGWGIPALALAGIQGYRSYKEYQQNVRENPAFFLWKVKDKSSD